MLPEDVRREEARQSQPERAASLDKWVNCSLSNEPLRPPVVIDEELITDVKMMI